MFDLFKCLHLLFQTPYTIDINQYSFRYAILKVINILILDIGGEGEKSLHIFLIFFKYLDTGTNLYFIECLKEHAFLGKKFTMWALANEVQTLALDLHSVQSITIHF